MGVDPGLVRTGIAIAINGVSLPFKVVKTSELVKELKKIASEKKIRKIVMGNGGDYETRCLVSALKKQLSGSFPDVEVILFNEEFTTLFASRLFPPPFRKNIDAVSASIILSDFLKYQQITSRKQK